MEHVVKYKVGYEVSRCVTNLPNQIVIVLNDLDVHHDELFHLLQMGLFDVLEAL